MQLLLVWCWCEGWVGGCKHRGQCYLLLPVINTIVCLPFTQLADVLIWLFYFYPSSVMRREPPIHSSSPGTTSDREKEKHHTDHAPGERMWQRRKDKINRLHEDERAPHQSVIEQDTSRNSALVCCCRLSFYWCPKACCCQPFIVFSME